MKYKLFILTIFFFYAVFWLASLETYDMQLGVSYSPQYARFLGLDHNETYDAILNDLKPSTIRLAVPWSQIEETRDVFNYQEIDEMIEKAKAHDAKVILTIGQKVPRWPECYIPAWTTDLNTDQRRAALLNYVGKTIERYKSNPAIELWQIENEAFIRFPFGNCQLFERDFVKGEIELVRKLDPSRQIVVTDSGELSSYRRPSFAGDILGTTLYRTVRVGGTWVAYYDWLPPAFYKFKARVWGNNAEHFFVSELQAEPWFLGDIPTTKEAIAEDKTFDPERFVENVKYAKKVGASRAYLWGVEWWYFMKVRIGDERYWDTAKQIFNSH